jgi:hypothetical protein
MIDKNDAMLAAIEVVTAWTDNQDDNEFVAERATQYTAGPDGGLTLTIGLITLSGVLLQNFAKARGDGTPEGERAILRELALRVERRRNREI